MRTTTFDGGPVHNHAKFLAIDHRFVLVTSANFSWSAEHGNVELGVRVDDTNLAEAVETEMRRAEDALYERVSCGGVDPDGARASRPDLRALTAETFVPGRGTCASSRRACRSLASARGHSRSPARWPCGPAPASSAIVRNHAGSPGTELA